MRSGLCAQNDQGVLCGSERSSSWRLRLTKVLSRTEFPCFAATERLPAVLTQQAQRSERFIDMILGGELREADVTDHSPPVDDERYAPWQPERRGHTVALSDEAVLVAQQ